VSDVISVGAGFVYGVGSLDLRQALPVHGINGPNSNDAGEARLHGNATGAGFNVGVQLKVNDQLQLGATYRSQVNMGISGGSAEFKVPQSLASSFPDTHFDTQLPMPLVTSVGIGYRPTEDFTVQFDLSYTGWNSYDSLRINFTDHSASLQDEHMPRHYRNTLTPRLGACYKINKVVSIMAGGAFDPTPVTSNYVSPDLPDADRINVTCGTAIKPLRGFTILAAFEGTGGMKRDANYEFSHFKGVYQTQAVTFGLGLYYNF
jgi:long-chain fatty acid transport protein